MTTLVTGATGLLGANLCRQLVAQGTRPRILVRTRSNRRGIADLKLEEVEGDVLNPSSLTVAMKGVETVYHLAGLVRMDLAMAEAVHELHVTGTRNVLEAAKAAGVRRLVHVSTVAAVGHGPLDRPATEETVFNFREDQPYHRSKREGEQLVLREAGDVEVVVANPGFLVGPYDVRPSSGALLLLVASGLSLFYPRGGNSFVGAKDVALGLIQAMARGRPGQRYILAGQNLTYRQFLNLCADEAGVAPPLLPVPKGPMRALGALGDWIGPWAPELLKDVNASLIESMFIPAYYSSQKAMGELGYRPQPVRRAIREAYRWFQDEGLLSRDCPLTPGGDLPEHPA